MEEIDRFIDERIRRKVVVVGASRTDAHTVGIDAIMNMKGFAGHYGLERYRNFEAYNMGSQVPNEGWWPKLSRSEPMPYWSPRQLRQERSSKEYDRSVELLEAENFAKDNSQRAGQDHSRTCQGARYDAGFGPGSFAEDVASFIVQKLETMIEICDKFIVDFLG